jgi:FkbM family methyltransferase
MAPQLVSSARDRIRPWLVARPRLFRAVRRTRALATRRAPKDPLGQTIWAFGQDHPRAFFVQVGANDGDGMDPLRDQITSRRWHGIMIEPVPYIFDRLAERHGADPRLTLVNAAIADEDGHRDLYYLAAADDDAPLPDWYDKLGSFQRDVIVKHRPAIPDFDRRLQTASVPCMTFETLCRTHGVTYIDLVQIDTEGYDFEILKLIDLDQLRPVLLMYEHLHFDEATRSACSEYLTSHGYEEVSDAVNTIALRTADLSAGHRHLAQVWQRLRQ